MKSIWLVAGLGLFALGCGRGGPAELPGGRDAATTPAGTGTELGSPPETGTGTGVQDSGSGVGGTATTGPGTMP